MVSLTPTDMLEVERELCRRSLSAFLRRAWTVIDPGQAYIHNWHMDAVCEHLEALARGELPSPRLLINVPPGTSKSTAVGVMYPAWLWGPFGQPSHRFIGASHDQDLAIRDNRKTRALVESEWYQALWPTKLVSDQNEKKFFENETTGFRQAVAVKSMTGRRGDTVVWDDPHSPEKAYSEADRETAIRIFRETLPNRLNNPDRSSIVVVMQRLHEQDVSGHILESEYGYTHLMLPMEFEPSRRCYTVIAPKFMESDPTLARYDAPRQEWHVDGEPIPPEHEVRVLSLPLQTVYLQDPRSDEGELLFEGRFPPEVVARDKKVMGEFAVAGQFQQRPAPRGGGMFPVERFQVIEHEPSKHEIVKLVRYWDKAGTAGGGAYTAGVLMAALRDGRYVVLDVYRKQVAAMDREAAIANLSDSDPYGTEVWVEQEPGSGGKESAEATVRRLAGKVVKIDRVTGDKVHRAQPYAAQQQASNIVLVKAPWNRVFIDEHEYFPSGKYKDQVDAAAGAFSRLAHEGKKAGVLF